MPIWPQGVEKRVFETLDSTMEEAARLQYSVNHPIWILAYHQIAGRGRRGRAWKQPDGNFSATLMYAPEGALVDRALRSFVASLALYDTLSEILGPQAGGLSLSLKWPNDVLLNGGKIAGILLESIEERLLIGVGVNLIDRPDMDALETDALRPVSLLGETGLRIAPEVFLDSLAAAYAKWEERFVQFGFDAIRDEWLKHAERLGQPIRARSGAETFHGIFENVDRQGRLVLKTDETRHFISAADVFF